jgi:hypothetical protein
LQISLPAMQPEVIRVDFWTDILPEWIDPVSELAALPATGIRSAGPHVEKQALADFGVQIRIGF